MKVLLSDCPEGHKSFVLEEDARDLDLGALIQTQGPVEIHLDVERRGDQLVLRGWASVHWKSACARCAKPLERTLRGEILAFADRRGKDEPTDEARLEQEGSILYHDGIQVTLTDVVREAILLDEPARVLCTEDCKGLCQLCGKNLGEGPRDCPVDEGDPRWEALMRRKSGKS